MIKVIYMNGTTVKYNSIKEFKKDYNILSNIDYSKIDNILVVSGTKGSYEYLRIKYSNRNIEWYKQIENSNNDYEKFNIKKTHKTKNISNLYLGREIEFLNLITENEEVIQYYQLKQQELKKLEEYLKKIGYSDCALYEMKHRDGAEVIDDFIDNLKDFICISI